jgi:hypothetical protein
MCEHLFKGGSIWGEHPRKEVKGDEVQQVREDNKDDSVCGTCDICEEAKDRKRVS